MKNSFLIRTILCLVFFSFPMMASALNAPTGVSASDGTKVNTVTVSWNSVLEATDYYIYRSEQPTSGYTLLYHLENTATSLGDGGAIAGVKYYYKVKAHSRFVTEFSDFSAYDTGYGGIKPPSLKI